MKKFKFGSADLDDSDFLPLITVDEEEDAQEIFQHDLPLIALRNTVLFPGVVIPISVGREKSVSAINAANKSDKTLAVVSQKNPAEEEPVKEDLNEVATVARIVKRLRMPDGSFTVIIQGKQRIKIQEITSEEPHFSARVAAYPVKMPSNKKSYKRILNQIKAMAEEVVKLSPQIPDEAAIVLKNVSNEEFLVHYIASNLNIPLKDRQEILEESDLEKRASVVTKHLEEELKQLEVKNQIQSKVRTDIEKQQRDYFLNQQMKIIQEELGGNPIEEEIKRLKEKARKLKWDAKAKKSFERELDKLQRINPAAAEYSVILNYLDMLTDLPWGKYTRDNFDLKKSRKVLDDDHYGLDKIKERILEYLAVLKLKGDMKSPILCFVGPPGVGKTSLGRSIAHAVGREYVRMSLGGLHDEAEIRGHRKTYIGAMPGRIIQNLKKVQSANPVFILDEVDKVGNDFRGDPSSALLEVLDPEQNSSFYDNYLELEFDLSKVMFIATANNLASIQPALRDRMEIIELGGYSVEEKIEIAIRHLIPKQREAHGLKAKQVKLNRSVIQNIIEDYTRESGVRELDRQIAAVMRHVAKQVAMDEEYDRNIKVSMLSGILGRKRFDRELYKEAAPAGVAVGMAYTAYGGEILYVESSLSHGHGHLTLTGNLGSVMKESASTALSFLKAHARDMGIKPHLFDNWNVHVHVPEGATPKDGPSAGVTMLAALASAFSQRRVKSGIAVTGEITLRGRLLPVGGIKEKLLAAKRAGMHTIILPENNRKDVEDIKPEYLEGLTINYASDMLEFLKMILSDVKEDTARSLDYDTGNIGYGKKAG